MVILSLDTATEACSAALHGHGAVRVRYAELERGHAERILGMIDELLAEAHLALRDLDALAFGRGPGAFTGVRLAASIAQGLAFGAGIPLIAVSDLRALAQRVLEAVPQAASVLAASDARMGEVYWACYRRDERGLATPSGQGEQVSAPDRVTLPAGLAEPLHGVGSGFRVHPQLARGLSAALAATHCWLPRAEEVGRLALEEAAAGRYVKLEDAVPVYLRDDVARATSRN